MADLLQLLFVIAALATALAMAAAMVAGGDAVLILVGALAVAPLVSRAALGRLVVIEVR